MPAPILYCGDTSLEGAAGYLAGVMTHWGWKFDYVPSHHRLPREVIERGHRLIILSDYPAARISAELQQVVVERVVRGTGLLMIGGWESFRGSEGKWRSTPIGKALPVEMGFRDDRVNFAQPTLLTRTSAAHPILDGLPWNEQPPTIGGLNRVTVKEDSDELLTAVSHQVSVANLKFVFQESDSSPALVVGQHGRGRTAAFTSDVAPHWVGGFVDWGPQRVKAQAPGAEAIEVGSHYAQFWKQLLAWAGRLKV